MNTTVETIARPKDLLERQPISKGDFVTTDDDSDVVKLYVVKSIDNDLATVLYLGLTHELDNVEVNEIVMPISSLIYADESFSSVGGLLWQIRETVISDKKRTMYNIEIHI